MVLIYVYDDNDNGNDGNDSNGNIDAKKMQ